jgi:hypothetical protein
MKRFINMVPGFITPLLGIYIALQGLSKPDTPTFTRSISMIVLLVFDVTQVCFYPKEILPVCFSLSSSSSLKAA